MTALRSDTETTSPSFLRDKYAIIGVGETAYTRGGALHLSAEGAAEFGLDVRRRYPDLFAERRHSPAPTISGP